ncbi:permease [Sporomusa malonica]|uniref:Predicted permease n=1 Tax=Sporomusa malonica TaxID=112901 RepID=A0A1W2DE73_9FIRM|nr:permease [Sporomusa malonica]SMC95790.1 Predicted permease [Sporomusa malonica]
MIDHKTKERVANEVKQSLWLILQVLPLILFGILISAAISSLLPPEMVMKFVGNEAGIKGIFIGGVAGALVPGEPFFGLPIAEGLAKAGAGYGALIAFISSWALFSVTLYPAEIAFFGWRFVLLRSLLNLFIPGLAGFIAYLIV